jgi:hypothetical protein
MMDEYGRLLSQDLPEDKFHEVVQETEAMVAVERAKHQLADAVRILEMVQRDFRGARAADEAVRLLKLLPNSKELKLDGSFPQLLRGGDDYLFGGDSIPTPTLRKIEETFGKAGLNDFSIEGGRVKVPHSQRATYLAALADAKALPRDLPLKRPENKDQ